MNFFLIPLLVLVGAWVIVTAWIGSWILLGEIKAWWFRRRFEREKGRRR